MAGRDGGRKGESGLVSALIKAMALNARGSNKWSGGRPCHYEEVAIARANHRVTYPARFMRSGKVGTGFPDHALVPLSRRSRARPV